MRVCLYTFQFPNYLGGVATYTFELYNYLVKNNHEVHVITRKDSKNIKVPGLHESRMFPIPIIHYITNGIEASDIIQHLQPDIIHAQHGGPGLWFPKYSFPLILTIHSLSQTYKKFYSRTSRQGMFLKFGSPILKLIEQQNFRHSDKIISVYSQGKNDLVRNYNVNPSKVITIPNGVDLNKFTPSNQNRQLIEKYGKIILFSGTNDERKGILELAKVIREFNHQKKNNDVSFVITGSGPLNQYLKELSKKYSNVHVLGYVSTNLLKELYASSQVFLFPTRIEAFPFSLLEALSSGLPIISSPVGGIPDLFLHKMDIGALIQPNNTFSIVGELNRMLDDDFLLNKRRRNARSLVEAHYDWDKICKEIVREYQNLITIS